MSYHSTVTGSFKIEPPLNTQEIREFPELPTCIEIELAIK